MAQADYFGAPAHLRIDDAQARCDAIQAEYRAAERQPRSIRRDPPPRPVLLPTDDELLSRIADELEYARRMIEHMGDTLAADPAIIARHMVSLQAVDIVGQMLGHIATIVRTSNRQDAVEQVGMSDLRARLKRRGGI